MKDELANLPEAAEIVELLLSGDNILLIGPNRPLIRRIMTLVKSELAKRTQVQEVQTPDEILPASSHVIADDLSPEHAIQIMMEHSKVTLFGAMPNAHTFGVSVAWAKELQRQIGQQSPLIRYLLSDLLKTLRCVAVPFSPASEIVKGAFREKLLAARYNQGSPAHDHGLLLRGWAREGDSCDPGWELDK